MQALIDSISFIRDAKADDPKADKEKLQNLFIGRFSPKRVRSVLVGKGYSLRFSEARTGSFSNTVLSLSALRAHDQSPFVVVVVRERGVDFLLANSTLLKKVSHSSHMLRVDNVKGSFNGSDILTEYEGQPNSPEYFDTLFAQHEAYSWQENLARLVEATNAIVGRDTRFTPTDNGRAILLQAPERAAKALKSSSFKNIEGELNRSVKGATRAILEAAQIENVNLRGNAIEQLLTATANSHDLGDMHRDLDGGKLVIDIKTKLLDRASAPKAYNVDKMLAFLSEPGSVLAFFIVGVNTNAGFVQTALLPILERSILDVTVVQHHWAGRSSRGVTQLSGKFGHGSDSNYQATVDIEKARAFIQKLLAL